MPSPISMIIFIIILTLLLATILLFQRLKWAYREIYRLQSKLKSLTPTDPQKEEEDE